MYTTVYARAFMYSCTASMPASNYTQSNKLKITLILGHQQSDYQIHQVYSLQPSPYFHGKPAPAVPTTITNNTKTFYRSIHDPLTTDHTHDPMVECSENTATNKIHKNT